jgi:hypothetical protein
MDDAYIALLTLCNVSLESPTACATRRSLTLRPQNWLLEQICEVEKGDGVVSSMNPFGFDSSPGSAYMMTSGATLQCQFWTFNLLELLQKSQLLQNLKE